MNYKFLDRNLLLNLETDADQSVFREIFLDRDYRCVEEILRGAKNCIVDVGAHIGLFSLYVASMKPNLPVFAYEPDLRNFAMLKWHLQENHLKNVFVKNVAVAGESGVRNFYLSEDSHNHSFVGGGLERRVDCITMEQILARDLAKREIAFCDLMKLDCEGAEFEILRSMNLSQAEKISNFYIEYHEFSSDMRHGELVDILKKFGYRLKIEKSTYDKRMGFILARR